MTKKGFKGVVFYEEMYKKAENFMVRYNAKAGYRKIRSMAHLIDLAIEEYIQKHQSEIVEKET